MRGLDFRKGDRLSVSLDLLQGFTIAGNKGVLLIAACQVPLMAGPEYARYIGIDSLQPVGTFLPGNNYYPGAALGLTFFSAPWPGHCHS
jgi:hypothetical protein